MNKIVLDNKKYLKRKCFAIPHPGTGVWIKNISFEEAMEKWFEGFNIPRMILENDKAEDFSISRQRVKIYFKNTKSNDNFHFS